MKDEKILREFGETQRRFGAVIDAFAEVEQRLARVRASIRELYVWSKAMEGLVYTVSDFVEMARKRSWILRWLFRGLDLTVTREKAALLRASIEGQLAAVERQQAEARETVRAQAASAEPTHAAP